MSLQASLLPALSMSRLQIDVWVKAAQVSGLAMCLQSPWAGRPPRNPAGDLEAASAQRGHGKSAAGALVSAVPFLPCCATLERHPVCREGARGLSSVSRGYILSVTGR